MNKRKKVYCNECDEFVDYKVIEKEKEYNVLDKEKITINAQIPICNSCENEMFVEELAEKNRQEAYDIYREKNNILSPKEIKEIRGKYGLTQKEMSKLLGWGEITYHRFENGTLPGPGYNNQLMLIQDPKNVLKLLEKGNHELEEEIEERLRGRINDLLKGQNVKTLELTLPSDFYEELKIEAAKNTMKLKEYVIFTLTKSHYEEKQKTSTKRKTVREASRKISEKFHEQEGEEKFLFR